MISCALAPVHTVFQPIKAAVLHQSIGDLLTINTLYAAEKSLANLMCMAQQANR